MLLRFAPVESVTFPSLALARPWRVHPNVGLLAEDGRLQPLLTPFIGFMDVTDPDLEPADIFDELLDEAATVFPRATIILRKIGQFSGPHSRFASHLISGRPCPVTSGYLKHLRHFSTAKAAPHHRSVTRASHTSIVENR